MRRLTRLTPSLCGLVLGTGLLLGAALQAQTEAETPLIAQPEGQGTSAEVLWMITTGDDALRTGLPSLAERFYREALASEALSPELRRSLTLKLATALISQRKLEPARELLSGLDPEQADAQEELRRALLAYYGSDMEGLKASLDAIEVGELPVEDKPWYYLLLGLWQRSSGTLSEAESSFDRALELTVSPAQRVDYEAEIFRSQILAGKADEDTARLLQKKVEETRGTRVGFGFARQYAIVLDLLGQKTQAIEVLQDQLRLMTDAEQAEQTEILLLIALVSGEDSQRGRLALEEILRNTPDKDSAALALNLLNQSPWGETDPVAFRQFLDELMADQAHPLSDELLMLRARILLQEGKPDQAARDAEALLNRFPGSPLRTDAIRLLAYQAWNANPPRYRTAADYLNQMREALPSGRERRQYGRLVADSYFLNGDFRTAAEVYEAILSEGPESAEQAELLLRLTEALSRDGRFEAAGEALDRATLSGTASPQARWQAEWSLASAMVRAGQVETALERVRALLAAQGEDMPRGLRLRLLWLEIKLASDLQQFESIPALTDVLLADIGATPDGVVSREDRETIAASALLLRGRAQIRLGDSDAALATFANLREKFPQSNAAVLSFLEEARNYAAQGVYNFAQLNYRKIADDYENSEQAIIALYEGALAAEAQGKPKNLRDALKYLEELAVEYPNHPLVFSARILQGDILRKLGEFSLAEQTYENLIQQFGSSRQDIYLVELYRANSRLAQAGTDSQRLMTVAAELENLFDRPDVPLDFQAETGFIWAHTLGAAGFPVRAQETLWRVVSTCAPDGNVRPALGARGRLWLSKSLFALSDLLLAGGQERESNNVLRIVYQNRLPGWRLAGSRLGIAEEVEG